MFVKVFGIKCRAEVIIVSIIIGMILGCNLLCGTMKTRENFDIIEIKEKLFEKKHIPYETYLGPSNKEDSNSLIYLKDNEYNADCCQYSSISGSSGCACITKEQNAYIVNRGGNGCGGL